ncbi:MAG: hypothetical protein IK066_05320 [Kiritimatiellae bacterium]|nr:hypothetical protein [Kiritimatiellia bacterium]
MKFGKMWKACAVAVAVAGLSGLCACEWGAGDDATSWSDTFNWVNFSGEYRTSGTKTVTKTSEKEQGGTVTSSESSATALTGSPFTVIQQGQNLTITDGKSGAVFTGRFSSMRSASGYENQAGSPVEAATSGVKGVDKHAMPSGGDTIIGSFEAKGPAGRLVGTFQGTVYDTDTNGTGDVFGNRTMTATLVGAKTVTIEATCVANTGITIFYPSSVTNAP